MTNLPNNKLQKILKQLSTRIDIGGFSKEQIALLKKIQKASKEANENQEFSQEELNALLGMFFMEIFS